MKHKILKIALVLSVFTLLLACNEDDLTGDSTLVSKSPSLSVSLDFENSQALIETEKTYGFTVSLSEVQIADVGVYLAQTGGTATEGLDFDFPHKVTIKAGTTSASDVITIHADDLIEETEDVTIEIATGLEANVNAISAETVSFSIANLVKGDLVIGLNWAATGYNSTNGTAYSPTQLADLRLMISTTSDKSNPITGGIADGGTFETLTLSGALADGDYYIVADWFDALTIPVAFDIDLGLTFDQGGVINGTSYSFSKALNSAGNCALNYFVLTKVTKTGESYAFTEIGENNFTTQIVSYAAGYDVLDAFAPVGHASQIKTKIDCGGIFLSGLNKTWMLDIWVEKVIKEGNVYYTIDESGNITIASQYVFTTLYSGAEYIYTISGTGTLVNGTLTINYFLDQEGFSPNQWMFDNGYMNQNYFIAVVTE